MINKKYGISAHQIRKYGFKLALEVYEKYNRKCNVCESEEVLCIHHLDFTGNTESPNNSLDNLQLLCQKCHGRLHGYQTAKKRWGEGHGIRKGREKEYMKEYGKKYYESHKDHIKKRHRAYDKKNRKRLNRYLREYRSKKRNIAQ